MSRFIESARLDTSAPDPYLGQARINAYELHDFDALAANLTEAEKRGYVPGRRERTQQGDTLRYRADRAIEQAVRAPLEDRRRLLGQASGDYQACADEIRWPDELPRRGEGAGVLPGTPRRGAAAVAADGRADGPRSARCD